MALSVHDSHQLELEPEWTYCKILKRNLHLPPPVCLTSKLIMPTNGSFVKNAWWMMLPKYASLDTSKYSFKTNLLCLTGFSLCDHFAHVFPIYWTYFSVKKWWRRLYNRRKKEFQRTQVNCMWNTLAILIFGSPSKGKANIFNILQCASSRGMPKPSQHDINDSGIAS